MNLIIFLFVGITVFFFANVNVTLQPGESPRNAVRYEIAGKVIVALIAAFAAVGFFSMFNL